ncbi:hypothetical protein [Desulfovibrio cuneatus]|uniref:hypothetical protein n=1 Tax=Desulfovibrio cuneatus TaxID=159728 RepID=UPI0003FE9BF3|nr:hypothetical protein [Desulfovibrio cuneatus]
MSVAMKWGILVVCLGAVCFGAYQLGFGRAEAEGLAAVRLVQVEREEERRAAAEAYGTALAETLARYQQEVAAAQRVAQTLSAKNNALETQAQTMRREIKNATAGSVHVFSAEFVRLWNGFIGAVSPAPRAVPAPGGAGGAAGAGTASAAAGAGVPGVGTAGSGNVLTAQNDPREGVPAGVAGRLASVTEEDVLEFMAYYGSRCQRLEAKEQAWQGLAAGWKR